MSEQELAGVWDMIRKHNDTIANLTHALAQVVQMREADKLVIEQLGATVGVLDARVAMLDARVDGLEPPERYSPGLG